LNAIKDQATTGICHGADIFQKLCFALVIESWEVAFEFENLTLARSEREEVLDV